jgi:hypothetical protein
MTDLPATPQSPMPVYAWSRLGYILELPGAVPAAVEAWCYTDRMSYSPGDTVDVHVHTNAPRYRLRVTRDGADPMVVWESDVIEGSAQQTPANAYEVGCGWAVGARIPVVEDWMSGFYLLTVSVEDGDHRHERDHFFVVRAPHSRRSPYVLIHTTSTQIAYNDWGGANHYRGIGEPPLDETPSPILSTQRPLARGMLCLPDHAPRESNPATPPPDFEPTYPAMDWAQANGYSRHYASAGWASYERPFTVWAERQGYEFDHLTQHDLHMSPGCLDGYECAVIVGHDEYWTWEMRDEVDRYVDDGGHLARFAGNFLWQVRLADDGRQQICYKDPSADPALDSDPARVTTLWDAPVVGRPGAQTMGLTALGGIYNRFGASTPRSTGGYTVYRPDHWVYKDTNLLYGDVFGGAPTCIATFELDGVDYTVRHGVPQPTFTDGAPATLEILAMAPAVSGETDLWSGKHPLGAPMSDHSSAVEAIWSGSPPERLATGYGAGMMATFTRGRGEVFNAGATEWVQGLRLGDPFTQQITHNVLRRVRESTKPQQ